MPAKLIVLCRCGTLNAVTAADPFKGLMVRPGQKVVTHLACSGCNTLVEVLTSFSVRFPATDPHVNVKPTLRLVKEEE